MWVAAPSGFIVSGVEIIREEEGKRKEGKVDGKWK